MFHSHGDQPATGPFQRGAVLAITLLILVVDTVLGVSGMSGSSLQMFLARNTQWKQLSFQNAKSAALSGERTYNTALMACLNDPLNCATDITRTQRTTVAPTPAIPGALAPVL